MSRGLSRKKSTLNIKSATLHFIVEKIDIIKSKLYNALIKQSEELIFKYQLKLLKSPLVILLNLYYSLSINREYLLSFDVGYFTLFFSSLSIANFNKYYDYIFIDLYVDKKQIVSDVNTSLALSIFKVYKKYLLYLDSFSSSVWSKIPDMSLYSNKKSVGVFNLYSFFYNLNFLFLLNQLNLVTLLKDYLKIVINKNFFLDSLYFLKLINSLIILRNKELSLIEYILSIYTIYIAYQASKMFEIYSFHLSTSKNNIQLYYHNAKIFLVSSKHEKIVSWFYCLKQYLKFNGLVSKNYFTTVKLFKLYKGTNCDLYNWQVNRKRFYLSLSLIPSLSYQFALLSQMKILLRGSKSKPLFLLIIRSNKILTYWSQFYSRVVRLKLYYLLDYLILILIRHKKKLIDTNSKCLYLKTELTTILSGKESSQKKYLINLVFSRKKYNNLYRQYCLFRLRWMS